MKFRKKPIVIEAQRYWGHAPQLPEGVCLCHEQQHRLAHIHTLEGVHLVSSGDWVITGIKGERYPCKPDIFEATYEQVADSVDVD